MSTYRDEALKAMPELPKREMVSNYLMERPLAAPIDVERAAPNTVAVEDAWSFISVSSARWRLPPNSNDDDSELAMVC